MSGAAQRVEAALAVARRIADASTPLGREARDGLRATSGLSPEGVELALSEHLEVSPTAADLEAFRASATPARAVCVVLAANVSTAPLRAIAWALASSAEVSVKPSRRDPGIAELLARELSLPVVDRIVAAPGDAVHAYGSDETLRSIAEALGEEVHFVGHGTGIGIAIVGDAGTGPAPSVPPDTSRSREAADAVARDLVPFDGRGCLSPRLVLASDPTRFGKELHEALTLRGERVPRGPLLPEERAALARARRTYQAIGDVHEGPHHMVLVDAEPETVALAPAHRITVVTTLDAPIGPLLRYVTTLGGEGGALMDALFDRCPRARRAALGEMQKPPLDGPVDLR